MAPSRIQGNYPGRSGVPSPPVIGSTFRGYARITEHHQTNVY